MASPNLDSCSAESLLCWEEGVSGSPTSGDDEQESRDDPYLMCKNYSWEFASASAAMGEMHDSDLQSAVTALIDREALNAPSEIAAKYETKLLDPGSRQKAISWLFKVRSFFNFGPLTAALSVNYLDRFLSRHQIPLGKAWIIQLLSVACLSLAAKMEEVHVPVLLDLQVAPDCLFEPKTIQRMELLVLSTLEWRMSSVTPFSYVDYFMCKCGLFGNANQGLVVRISELILCAMQDLRFLHYQYSSVAAAAILVAAKERLPLQLENFRRMIFSMLPLIAQEFSAKCFRLIVDHFSDSSCMLHMKAAKFADSVPLSPAGVLDASFSSNSESMFKSVGSDPIVQISSPALKKRRVDHFCNSVLCCS